MHMEQRDPLTLENQKTKRTEFHPSELVGVRGWGVPSKPLGFYKPRVAVPSPAPLVAPQKGATRVGGLGTLPGGLDGNNPPTPLLLAESPGGGGWQPWLAAKDEVTKVVAVHHPLLLAEPPGGGG